MLIIINNGDLVGTFEQYIDFAKSDDRVVSVAVHPDNFGAAYFSHMKGIASPTSKCWPVYVRSTMNHGSWGPGSLVVLPPGRNLTQQKRVERQGICKKTQQHLLAHSMPNLY